MMWVILVWVVGWIACTGGALLFAIPKMEQDGDIDQDTQDTIREVPFVVFLTMAAVCTIWPVLLVKVIFHRPKG